MSKIQKTRTFFFIRRRKDGMYYAGMFDNEPLFCTDITEAWRFYVREEAQARVKELQKRKWYRLFRKDQYAILTGKKYRS